MKRVTVLILSTAVTVLLVVAVLAAGQPRTQNNSAPVTASAPAAVDAVQSSAPASDALALPQFDTGHREHQDNEHHDRNSFSSTLSDD
jgi:hypothetical protein